LTDLSINDKIQVLSSLWKISGMSLRDSINRRGALVAFASVVLIGAVVCMALLKLKSSDERTPVSAGGRKAWYSIDDGKTWFAGAADRLTPFDNGGTTAYRCLVWSCDGGKTKFVSHLERYKAPVLREYQVKGKVEAWELPPGMVEVKSALSGDRGWVDANSPQASSIKTPRCPGGGRDSPQPVQPD
jgi:hypothetical protein